MLAYSPALTDHSLMETQSESQHRGWILVLAGLLIIQIASAFVWQKWFRHETGASIGVVPKMQEYTRERRYEEAVRIGLHSLKNVPADDTILQQIAVVYLRRAQIEPDNKARDAGQAVEYAEKALASNPANQANLYGTARVLDIAGDFSTARKCEFYKRSVSIFQERVSLLQSETISVGDKNMKTAPLKQENEYLLNRVKTKIAKAGCP